MQTNALSPAYPIAPMQDNFGRMVVPIAGLSKLEHYALEIYKAKIMNNLDEFDIVLMDISIEQAITFLEKLDEILKTLNNDKSNEMAIFDR